jgi:two-component system sensor histidine kinase YesM
LNKRLQRLGIGRRMLVLLLGVSLVPIIFVLLISYRQSASTITRQTGELIEANLEQSSGNVQNFLDTFENLIQDIYTDQTYVDNLKPINIWDSSGFYLAKHKIEENLQNIVYINKNILGIAVTGIYGDVCFYDSMTLSGAESFCFDLDNIRNNEMVKQAYAEKQTVYSRTYHKLDTRYGEKDYFYVAHQLTDFNDYKEGPVGCILLCVDEKALCDVYKQGSTKSNITFVVNRYGDIISYPEGNYGERNIFAGEEKKERSKEEIEQAAQKFVENNRYPQGASLSARSKGVQNQTFYVVNVRDLNYVLKDLHNLTFLIVLVGLLAGVICVLIAVSFSKDMDRSVKPILNAMDKANEGNMEVRVPEEGMDEFARIGRHFNSMLSQIRTSNEQEKEALVREKYAEIKSLEAQINPHFLYNTLDAINWVAIDRKEYSISKMLTSLALILRYSIHKSNEIVEIRDELEYLKRYVYLQQQRFEYSFICTVEADENLMKCRIHKLLIQPLLENTLVHGFPGNTGMDEINIRLTKAGEHKISIVVKDNGKGMEEGQAEYFNHFDYKKERIESSIGVRNVITRIKLYYGEQGSFHVESSQEGTVITILIPYE